MTCFNFFQKGVKAGTIEVRTAVPIVRKMPDISHAMLTGIFFKVHFLFITEGEKELGEKAVSCQLVQLVGAGEEDVEKVSLTELTEPWQIHPEGSNLRIRYSLKLQRHVSTQIFVVTLPALPVPVQLVPFVYHSQKIRFCPGCFL